MALTLGAWRALPGGWAATLAVDGERTAAAAAGRITVWEGEREIAEATTATRVGRPRFAGERVLWGAGALDLASGRYRAVEGIGAALVEGTGETPGLPDWPLPQGRGYVPTAYAWSPDGEMLVASASWGGPPGPPAARVVLVTAAGEHRATLWQASDLAPTAAWVGHSALVVGCRQPRVFDLQGQELATLEGVTPPVRIEASADESRLLVVEHGRLALWRTADWSELVTHQGAWLDASLSPDGRLLAAVDFEGRLRIAAVAEQWRELTRPALPAAITGLALGEERLAATFADGDALRRARIRFETGGAG